MHHVAPGTLFMIPFSLYMTEAMAPQKKGALGRR
jgi:hypothetical protein